MAEIIQLSDYLRRCENCKWHDDKNCKCIRPGGWSWTDDYQHCADFEYRKNPWKKEETNND